MIRQLYIAAFLACNAVAWAQLAVEHTVYFDLDKDKFQTQEGIRLNDFLDDLIYKPILEIRILGYCDDRGSKQYNLDLSNRRVETVSKWLQQHDIRVQNITKYVEGMGEVDLEERLDDEELEYTRAKNRRVDVTFVLTKELESRVQIKKLTRSKLNEEEKENIDAYEAAVIKQVTDAPLSKEKIVIAGFEPEKPEEFIEVPTKLNPPVDNAKEPFKSLLSKNLKEGRIINLDNILFFKGRSTILPESLPLLDRMAEILIARKDIFFEIQGHVCCINASYPDAYNRDTKKSNLSHARALAIFQILRKAGVESSRMKFKGYGRTKPLGGIDKLDRRVELHVIKMDKAE
jgi:outer membrane protein OmpA-like peptidoglycan-associated protein